MNPYGRLTNCRSTKLWKQLLGFRHCELKIIFRPISHTKWIPHIHAATAKSLLQFVSQLTRLNQHTLTTQSDECHIMNPLSQGHARVRRTQNIYHSSLNFNPTMNVHVFICTYAFPFSSESRQSQMCVLVSHHYSRIRHPSPFCWPLSAYASLLSQRVTPPPTPPNEWTQEEKKLGGLGTAQRTDVGPAVQNCTTAQSQNE
jgi:hypothetical protein